MSKTPSNRIHGAPKARTQRSIAANWHLPHQIETAPSRWSPAPPAR